jgi:hypothetical protein
MASEEEFRRAAYKRAMDALEECYQQGWRDEPLSGDSLLYAAVSDEHIADGRGRVNAFRDKYERGLLKLRYFQYPDELEVSNG